MFPGLAAVARCACIGLATADCTGWRANLAILSPECLLALPSEATTTSGTTTTMASKLVTFTFTFTVHALILPAEVSSRLSLVFRQLRATVLFTAPNIGCW